MKWAALIPLIGGFPIGAYQALQIDPIALYSFDGFQSNDSHCVNFFENVNYIVNPEKLEKDLDLVVMTPPCSALSSLNCQSSSDYESVEWLYKSAKLCMDNHVKVIIGENAPALFTNKGKPVAQKLLKMAEENNYSLTLIHTNTLLHGIPQSRIRTFYVFCYKKNALSFIPNFKRKTPTLGEWLKSLPINCSLNEEQNHSATQVKFIEKLLKEKKIEKETYHKFKTFYGILDMNKLWKEYILFCDKHKDNKSIDRIEKILIKLANGKNFWDNSIHLYKDQINAIAGRIFNNAFFTTEHRFLTIREYMHLMGLPPDFELVEPNYNHICQNVPTYTAQDIVDMCMDAYYNDKVSQTVFNKISFIDFAKNRKDSKSKNLRRLFNG